MIAIAAAVAMLKAIIEGVYRTAHEEGIIQNDPTLHLKKPKAGKPKEKRAFTHEENVIIQKVITQSRNGLLLGALYYLGLRRGEAVGLKWGDINWDSRTVDVSRDIDYNANHKGIEDNVKSDCSVRTIPIPEELYSLLFSKRGLPNMFIFNHGKTHYSRTMFQRAWIELRCNNKNKVFTS